MKKYVSLLVLIGGISLAFVGNSFANPFGFTQITSNGAVDVSPQLNVVVSSTLDTTWFTFANTGPLDSFINQIYFDWTTPLTFLGFSESIGVDYTDEKVNPKNLPGGNDISFVSDWEAGAEPSPAINGINNYVTGIGDPDVLYIIFSGSMFDNNILAALGDESLTIGLHVQGMGKDREFSNSYVTGGGPPNNPVPEPATMLLFGTGLFGLAAARLRKKKK
jgi:hypothetical protein